MLAGTVIGAGVFALPALAVQSGFVVAALLLVVLTGVMVVLHLMLGDISVAMETPHRIPGYAAAYLGSRAGRLSLLATLAGVGGVLLAYLVLLDAFAKDIFGQVPDSRFAVSGWLLLTLLVIGGIRTIAQTEVAMSVVLALLLAYVAFAAAPHISTTNLTAFGSWGSVLAPFGAILFSLGGFSAVPEMQQFFGRDQRAFRRAIIAGILFSAALYLLFMTAFVGAFGSTLTETLTDAARALGRGPEIALSLFGVIAVATSYLMLGAYFVDTLTHDLRLPRAAARAALALPLLLFALGMRDFLLLVGIVGSVFAGSDGTVIVLSWLRLRKSGQYPGMLPFSYRAVMVSGVLFGAGVVGSIVAEVV